MPDGVMRKRTLSSRGPARGTGRRGWIKPYPRGNNREDRTAPPSGGVVLRHQPALTAGLFVAKGRVARVPTPRAGPPASAQAAFSKLSCCCP
jgi:hypothetical protein